MTSQYSLAEVFRMAEQIERNGRKFYLQAADAASDSFTRSVMKDLAEKEAEHEKLFAGWRQKFCEKDEIHFVDLDDQAKAYIHSAADSHVFNVDPDVAKLLASVQSPASTFRLAIQFEKDTIAYFTALKNTVLDEYKEKVDLLIQQELQHIHQLQQGLETLRKQSKS